MFHSHDNEAFSFQWYGNTWIKTFYSQRILIGYNIELAESVYTLVFIVIIIIININIIIIIITGDQGKEASFILEAYW